MPCFSWLLEKMLNYSINQLSYFFFVKRNSYQSTLLRQWTALAQLASPGHSHLEGQGSSPVVAFGIQGYEQPLKSIMD